MRLRSERRVSHLRDRCICSLAHCGRSLSLESDRGLPGRRLLCGPARQGDRHRLGEGEAQAAAPLSRQTDRGRKGIAMSTCTKWVTKAVSICKNWTSQLDYECTTWGDEC